MLVDAWNKDTGKRLPRLIPEHYIGHPVLGPNLINHPPEKRGDSSVNKPAGKAAKNKEESNGTNAR